MWQILATHHMLKTAHFIKAERSVDVTAITYVQMGTNDADRSMLHDAVKGRSIYPNLKLRIYTTGIRQNRLAKLVGIDGAYLSRIVNGGRVPGQQIRLQIANVLGCDAEWLFERTTVEATGNTVRESAKID